MPEFEVSKGNNKKTLKMFRHDNTILVFIILLVVFALIFLAGSLFFYSKIKNSNVIQPGVYIKGINVSEKTKEEAKALVEQELNQIMNDHIVLTYKDIEYYVEIEQIEAKFDIDSAVEYAYNLTRTGNFFEDVPRYISVLLTNVNIDLDLIYNDDALTRYITQIEAELPDQL